MTIPFMGGDGDTGVSGIASRSSLYKDRLKLDNLFNTSAISLGAVTWPVGDCSELISVVSSF